MGWVNAGGRDFSSKLSATVEGSVADVLLTYLILATLAAAAASSANAGPRGGIFFSLPPTITNPPAPFETPAETNVATIVKLFRFFFATVPPCPT